MSRDLGPTQQAILDLLDDALDALAISAIAEKLGLGERRIRDAVERLTARQLVVTTREQVGISSRGTPVMGTGVWLPERYEARWLEDWRRSADEAFARWMERRGPRKCEACGQPIRPTMPTTPVAHSGSAR